ncbi:tRNA guanosine-2'-O-methyltransferase [Lyophyllum atratum]|nr:tRNA guanosine-2'-O-methyltransferase [Lyophyllum atratum]
MPQYLIVFAQVHHEFRIPELMSVAELHGFTVTLPPTPEDRDPTRPYMVVALDQEEHALILARRCILVKSVYEFYGQGSSYEELHACTRTNHALWARYIPHTSFRFLVTAHNHKIPQSRQHAVVESFSYMGLLGKIDMKNPELLFGCFEEYSSRNGIIRDKHEGDGHFRQVYFGRLLEEGSARLLIGKFDVKKRAYYGNTSMESEISLLMANQTLAAPGKLIYDPFMGTGSMAYTTSHFGALVFGSDIDGRQMRGKENDPGVLRAARQYGTESRVLDLCTFDVTRNPWRCGGLFDAIVTDPPYGVRAGAKRLGRKKELSEEQLKMFLEYRNSPRFDDQPYFPPTKPYELSHLAADLVLLARYLLKPGGRLVFFLPTVTDEYEEIDIDSMLCEGMEVIANSLQDFGSWGRRLVTVRKTTDRQYPRPLFEQESQADVTHVPAHKDFREKYFQGFKKEDSEEVPIQST